jgi:hypothetical protein
MVDDVPQDVVHSVAAPASSAEDAAHAEQLLERLNVSLSQLSPRQQQIFILSRLHGQLPGNRRQLDVSLSTVQKELKLIMSICIGVAERWMGLRSQATASIDWISGLDPARSFLSRARHCRGNTVTDTHRPPSPDRRRMPVRWTRLSTG